MIVFHFNAETARMFADLFTPQDSGYLPLVGLNWRELLLVNFTLGTVFALIWSQRQQREGLLRAAGILESEQENRATKSLGAIGRHLFVGLTCLHVGLVFLTFHLTAAVGRQIAYGPPILPRSERLVNGWDAMNARFTRTTIPSATMTELGNGLNFAQIAPIEPKNFPAASSFVSVKDLMTSSVFRAEMAKFEQRFSPWINDFKTAAEADYLSPNTGKQYVIPSFLHLRTIVRWLSLSSQVAMSDGDWKKALEPIEILYRYTALEMDGILVGHMIHVAIKGIANQTGTLYWQAFYDNREAMDALAAVLERASASNRRSFPWENIQRHEPSHSPVVVYADIMVPSYTRAVGTYEQASSGMDQLTIATASARMRKETGAWPTTIDEIPTKFLPASVARSAKSSKLQFAVEPDQLRIQRSADPTTGTQAGRLPALRFLIQSSAAHP
jgi:hypothetical protein